MKLFMIVPLFALLTITQQAPSLEECLCEFTNSEKVFPHDKLSSVGDNASKCNSNINAQKTLEMERLLQSLEKRLPQLQEDVSVLEREDDGDVYAVLSLYVIENELRTINQLIERLNRTTQAHLHLTTNTTQQLEDLRAEMQELETYDTMHVMKTQQDNKRLQKDLQQCRGGLYSAAQPTQPPHSKCPYGQLLNITGPTLTTQGEYPGSYQYGAWGRDPKPETGKGKWHWLVMLTSGDKFSNYVRFYSSLSSLIVGVSTPGNVQIHASNPTTNTIQGPNVVMYGGALYYNCYNQAAVCRFNFTAKTVTNLQLPKGTRFNSNSNFCHLEACYPFTDLDLATDESGVWVIYTTTQDFGNLVLSKVEEGEPPRLGQTWRTSIFKKGVTNTFMACGVLYATRYVSKDVEEIFYSFDTTTGEERFNINIFINKVSPNIHALNYSPVDQMLHVYGDSYMVSYKVVFAGVAPMPNDQPTEVPDLESDSSGENDHTFLDIEDLWDYWTTG
ncbi:olfactomedin-4-like [Plectropomus leopardus]|uniref:olfactomedin-4-like n=1 Tax=Plectropomus leopardus TaxID=160734 RepID=UPI001C4C962D|nr:olfactomedin-4-like [Plectropomus leopardus]